MPKIIKDLKDQILASAIKIFNESDFKGVSLRKIASECNIAVGTLYNYYPGKKEIMFDVFNKLWTNTFDYLEIFIEENKHDKDLFIKYLDELHEEMDKRKGLGRDLIALEMQENQNSKTTDLIGRSSIAPLQNKQLKKVIVYSFNVDESEINKIKNIDILTKTTFILAMIYKDEHQDNKYFLKDLVENYISK
ncbi:MAG: TetR/AcrR family transcriptional regulator [Firmicutes bacterium]|jgi:AcrR family transcriptional regulator|nr:TetR/AcrR family transcriptional regulator [Bacillota bacterium]